MRNPVPMTNWLHGFAVFPTQVLLGVDHLELTRERKELGANADETR